MLVLLVSIFRTVTIKLHENYLMRLELRAMGSTEIPNISAKGDQRSSHCQNLKKFKYEWSYGWQKSTHSNATARYHFSSFYSNP